MKEDRQRFPLSWPLDWKRTRPRDRRRASFARTVTEQSEVTSASGQRELRTTRRAAPLTVAAALDRLDAELNRLGATDPLLSTNVPVGVRGVPLSKSWAEPQDTGVACYLMLQGKPLVFACDKWDRVADNIAAIAQHIDALRRIERYGVGKVEQAFAGYAALPPAADDWRAILGVGEYATLDQVDAAFLEKAKQLHPDAGGSHDQMAALTAARDFARKVLA